MSSLFLLAQDNYHKYIASLLVGITALAAGLYMYGVKPELGPERGGWVKGGNSSVVVVLEGIF